ncbi:MAG: FAD-dependent oxidoreductase [Leptospirales bacterium]
METEIIENRRATPFLHTIKIAKPVGFKHIVGQYIKITLEKDSEGIFTIASHPDRPYLELLVSKSGDTAAKLCKLAPGDVIQISEPVGPGFAVESFADKTIYLIAHGSGISAIKPLVEELRKKRNLYGPIRLLYGVRTVQDFPYPALFRDWMGSIEYYDIISKKPENMSEYNGEIGHVQDILKNIKPEPENAVAIISGSPDFEKEIREILVSHSFGEEQIVRNY